MLNSAIVSRCEAQKVSRAMIIQGQLQALKRQQNRSKKRKQQLASTRALWSIASQQHYLIHASSELVAQEETSRKFAGSARMDSGKPRQFCGLCEPAGVRNADFVTDRGPLRLVRWRRWSGCNGDWGHFPA